MNIHIIALTLLLWLVLVPTVSSAQEFREKPFTLNTDQTFNLPPFDQIERRHLDEMNAVYHQCLSDSFAFGHRDCKCYAMAFLEERLKIPTVDREVVETAVENVCYDPKRMAGYYFQQCVNSMNLNVINSKKDPVSLCECFGKAISRNFTTLNNTSFTALQSLRANAYGECHFYD